MSDVRDFGCGGGGGGDFGGGGGEDALRKRRRRNSCGSATTTIEQVSSDKITFEKHNKRSKTVFLEEPARYDYTFKLSTGFLTQEILNVINTERKCVYLDADNVIHLLTAEHCVLCNSCPTVSCADIPTGNIQNILDTYRIYMWRPRFNASSLEFEPAASFSTDNVAAKRFDGVTDTICMENVTHVPGVFFAEMGHAVYDWNLDRRRLTIYFSCP